jgi:hypothetical protein
MVLLLIGIVIGVNLSIVLLGVLRMASDGEQS